MFKVLIADKLSEEAVRIFSDNGIEAIVKNGLDESALIEELQDYDGLVVRSATKATNIATFIRPRSFGLLWAFVGPRLFGRCCTFVGPRLF